MKEELKKELKAVYDDLFYGLQDAGLEAFCNSKDSQEFLDYLNEHALPVYEFDFLKNPLFSNLRKYHLFKEDFEDTYFIKEFKAIKEKYEKIVAFDYEAGMDYILTTLLEDLVVPILKIFKERNEG